MLTLSDKGTTINLDNLEQFINHINVQKLKAGTPLDKFYTKMIQFNNLVDFNKISITNVQYDRNTTLKEIEGLVKEYLSKNPWEAIKQLAESESWKGLFSSEVSGETFKGGILRVFTDEDVNKFVKDLIEKNLEGYLQFGKALRYHSEMERPNFHADKPDDNINPGDIKDDYDKTRACAIVALMYAEESVFGLDIQKVGEFHEILIKYFKSYPKQNNETRNNVRNTVWRNYSDNHVYPSMYKFFGYEPLNNSEIKGKWLKAVCEEPNVNGLIGKRGIIIVSEHAIGFRCPDGVMKLCDNDSGEYGVSGINFQHRNKNVLEIYVKSL